jgi:hypothetical protein
MSAADFDATLAPLVAASRSAAALDISTLTADQAESALIIARNLSVITNQLTGRISARYPLLRIPFAGQPGSQETETVLPMWAGKHRDRP